MAAFGSDLCLHLLLLPSSSLVGLSCSFGLQSIELRLPIRGFLLQFPQSLYLLLFLLLDALLLSNQLGFLLALLLQVGNNLLLLFALFVLTLLDDESGVAIGLHDLLIHHVLLLLLFLPIAKHVPRA